MGLGAFAGGIAKGINEYEDIQTKRKNRELAEKELGLREKAAERDDTRFKWDTEQHDRDEQMRQELAATVDRHLGQFRQPAQQALPGPLDARDAQAGTMQDATTNIQGPAGGFDFRDPAVQSAMFAASVDQYAIQAKYGKIDPAKMLELQKTYKAWEKDGRADAFRKFMMGDRSALDTMAQENGFDRFDFTYKVDPNTKQLQQYIIGFKGDKPAMELPTAVGAAVLGAGDVAGFLDKQADNERGDRKTASEIALHDSQIKLNDAHGAYYRGRGAAAAGAGDDRYDPKMVPSLLSSYTFELPDNVAGGLPGKARPNTWAERLVRTEAARDYREGRMLPDAAVDLYASIAQNATQTLAASGRKFKNQAEFDAAAQKLVEAALAARRQQRAAKGGASAFNGPDGQRMQDATTKAMSSEEEKKTAQNMYTALDNPSVPKQDKADAAQWLIDHGYNPTKPITTDAPAADKPARRASAIPGYGEQADNSPAWSSDTSAIGAAQREKPQFDKSGRRVPSAETVAAAKQELDAAKSKYNDAKSKGASRAAMIAVESELNRKQEKYDELNSIKPSTKGK